MSLSSRRAWIEILKITVVYCVQSSRSPHGERGLKCKSLRITTSAFGRSPHGERGLK